MMIRMTGLDASKDCIIEIAVLITDGDLNIVAEGPELIINQPKALMDGMDAWCREHHGSSGLTAAVLASTITMAEAERAVLDFVQQYVPDARTAPLAGNSVHADRVFLRKDMPRLEAHLHYRNVDVSTIKELVRRWYPAIFQTAPKKKCSHRALDDIKESLKELEFYRKACFVAPPATT
ncbi:ribonuclease H-like domain-containing protein [Thamnocephalis sphaerospora]|uniref:Ribonuclease H-like domain-containing protein n=1 Tax=Thamnocephalis sphaerospora TaxID=78915 RepID=A0A4P9XTM4_9FUNG|nr:ribonuclease H-like domain-containing protein [Thamnocephalis sphaerospora]|eukprot:RKP08901.1 ribonuclease H-like domain-containing protein [Thamnocephalis sphaerospora]